MKNPSCETVEVKDIKTVPALQLTGNNHLCYEIIIPKEEPKKETLEEVAEIITTTKFSWEEDKKMYSEEEVLKAQQAILANIKDALQDENYIINYLKQFKNK